MDLIVPPAAASEACESMFHSSVPDVLLLAVPTTVVVTFGTG